MSRNSTAVAWQLAGGVLTAGKVCSSVSVQASTKVLCFFLATQSKPQAHYNIAHFSRELAFLK